MTTYHLPCSFPVIFSYLVFLLLVQIASSIPRDAAADYADPNYGKVMLSKIFCVHMVNALGHDMLFLDVDIALYRDPLPYFASKTGFDMYFQHNGLHKTRFAPLGANSGFYFVRYNEKTRHFFSVFSRMGDLVLATRSHQAALTMLLNEHMSLRGLRVKVLQDEQTDFPTGYHLHRGHRVVGRMMAGDHAADPYLFHANWLKSQDKIPALRKTRNWYIGEDDTCKGLGCCRPDPVFWENQTTTQ